MCTSTAQGVLGGSGPGGNGVTGRPALQFSQPVVLLEPAAAEAGAGGRIGTGFPGHTWLIPNFGGLLAHEPS